MKIKIFWIFIFICFSFYARSQSDSEIKKIVASLPKGVKQIGVHIKEVKTKNETLSRLISYMIDLGYEVDNVDRELGILQTKDKNIKFSWSNRYSFIVGDSTIKIKGKLVLETANNAARDIENKGALGDAYVYSFREMVRIAYGIPHIKLEYK